MKGVTLKRLADASDASKLDLMPADLVLSDTADGALAWYRGSYVACGVIAVDVQFGLLQPVSVASKDFQALVALFADDDDVSIKMVQSSLALSSRSRKVSLRFRAEGDSDGYAKLKAETVSLSVPRADLAREINNASLAVSTSYVNPVLTGVRLIADGSVLGIQAANGVSLMYEGVGEAKSSGRLELIAPANDFATGLGIAGQGEEIKVAVSERAFTLIGDDAVVQLPRLTGQWPQLSRVRQLEFSGALIVPVTALKAAIQATKIYKAGNLLTFRQVEGGVSLESVESEAGLYQEAIEGEIPQSYTLDMDDLDAAAKIASGETLTLAFAPNMVRIVDGQHKLYIMSRA